MRMDFEIACPGCAQQVGCCAEYSGGRWYLYTDEHPCDEFEAATGDQGAILEQVMADHQASRADYLADRDR